MNIDEDDTRLFRPLEPGEFGIYTELDELPVSGCPVYLMKGVGGICLSGTATVQVFGHRFRIVRGMVLALFPWQLISIKEVSDDFGIRFFRNYPAIIAQSYSLFNEIPNFLVRALRNRCYADGFLRKNNGGTNRGPAVIFRLFRQARCAMSHSAICTAFRAAPLRI